MFADASSMTTYTTASPLTAFFDGPPPSPTPLGFPDPHWTFPEAPKLFTLPAGVTFSFSTRFPGSASGTSVSVKVSSEMGVSDSPTGPFGPTATTTTTGDTAIFYALGSGPSPAVLAGTIEATAPSPGLAFVGTIIDIAGAPTYDPPPPPPDYASAPPAFVYTGVPVSFFVKTAPDGYQTHIKWTIIRTDFASYQLAGPCPGSGTGPDGSHLVVAFGSRAAFLVNARIFGTVPEFFNPKKTTTVGLGAEIDFQVTDEDGPLALGGDPNARDSSGVDLPTLRAELAGQGGTAPIDSSRFIYKDVMGSKGTATFVMGTRIRFLATYSELSLPGGTTTLQVFVKDVAGNRLSPDNTTLPFDFGP